MSLDMSLCPSVLQVLAHLPIVRPPPLEDIFSDLLVLVADPHHRTAGRKRTMLKPGGHAPVDDLRTSKGLQLQRRAARVIDEEGAIRQDGKCKRRDNVDNPVPQTSTHPQGPARPHKEPDLFDCFNLSTGAKPRLVLLVSPVTPVTLQI